MSEELKLKCQFCPLDFNSVYKIIPHIYFGHRKKIMRHVRDHNEIKLKCPVTSCDWYYSVPMASGTDPEIVYAELANMFVVLEDHILTQHTHEQKLVSCPYCQKDLTGLVYWVHLEEHMNNTSSTSPGTPSKTTPPPAQNVTPPPEQKVQHLETSPQLKSPANVKESPSPVVDVKSSPIKTVEAATPEVSKVETLEPKAETDSTADNEAKTRRTTRSSKGRSQEEIRNQLLEIEKKIKEKKKEDELKKQREEEARKKLIEEEKRIKEEEERKIRELELKKERELELKKQKEEDQRKKREEKLRIQREEELERKKQKEEELRKKKEAEKLREEEIRKQREAEIERQRLKEIERKRKDEEERIRMDEESQRQREEDLKRQVEEQMRILKEEEDKKKGLEDQKKKVKEYDHSITNTERPVSDDKLDTRITSSSTTPGSKSRSREVSGDIQDRRRSISGDKKRSSVWNTDKDGVKEPQEVVVKQTDPKTKPVLTEEMERSIIYGNFKKKESSSREDKLVAVKKEIESRFKAEEERRRRLMEEKRKAEEKEREKMRLAEEKLKKEREKLKEEKRKTRKRLEELKAKDSVESMDTEDTVIEEIAEEETVGIETEEAPSVSPKKERSKSPDQYEKIKMKIKELDKEIEKKQEAMRVDKLVEDSRSRSISPEPDLEPMIEASFDTHKFSTALPKPVVAYQIEEDEEDLDDLEVMMREFQEREKKKSSSSNSLTALQENYNTKKQAKTPSPRANKSPTIPSGFDKDGHPLASSILNLTLPRTGYWAMCKEDDPNLSFQSSYQLLAHIFLNHRKKIVSNSRKLRKMSLACPVPGCGFMTTSSSQGVSIDYFNSQLPLHLLELCDHLRTQHTGEDKMDMVHPISQVQLDLTQAWSWQHLANHRDARRFYCGGCNNFPFKTEQHKCPGQAEVVLDKSTKSLEELAKDVETGAIRAEELTLKPKDLETEDVSDTELETESFKIDHQQRSQEKRLEREKEERKIVIPKLPKKCNNCNEILRTPAQWKYHVMAHKYGEVYCSKSNSWVLGHKFLDQKVTSEEDTDSSVKLVKYRGDTWLDILETKVKVFYEYEDRGAYHGRVTVAKCSYCSVNLVGSGDNHEQATNHLRKEAEEFIIKLKENDSSKDKMKEVEEDQQALMDMFIELARVDQVLSKSTFSLKFDEKEVPVETDLWFSKYGKVYNIASVTRENQKISEIGLTAIEAVNNLAEKIKKMKNS